MVLIHSSSVSWTKVETEKDQDLLEREGKDGIVLGGTRERDGVEDMKCHNTERERGWAGSEESEGSSTHMPAQEKQITKQGH